ncbi:D-alanyl-D-alanine carboxypeptidase family protein [Cohnella lubricantis]|uniref:D-alanyl-D-alanine carboxypeptidase n=1 Tax=Cohnella lubricantis TaxID=2163172 RepID=A0A841T876_9BACL|nr:D-alanyl-D-alanine carboxypeptidase family protein [Cohnella lubricantis]MBB6677703.1 D-alanyl-D-alanine carboxypeptidase [Cohnella lubricantis]MBP2117665.1 D-alanyl-D-alanine carboxypeptidase [Cohnella lubricantis]
MNRNYRNRQRAAHRLIRIAASFILVTVLVWPAGALASASKRPPEAAERGPGTHALAAALIDVTSGRLLYSSNGDKQMRIASLTKIMTAIVAIENGRLDDMVTVSSRAAGKEGSSLYLKAGEKMKLSDLLYGLMLRSGNDAATAIAEHVGGSIEGFVYLMNRKAEELGLKQTNFANPHGLDEEGHYSSANDLAVLTAYALRNKTFRTIVGTKVKTAPNPNDAWDYKWVNKNKMLTMYEGADGVKTGYTRQALRCLVSSATRGGQQLAAVTLNDRSDWADHRRMLDFGFAKYPLQLVVSKNEPVAGYPLAPVADFRYPFAAGERDKLRIRIEPLPSTSIDYRFGYRGRIVFRMDGRTIGTVGLSELPGGGSN